MQRSLANGFLAGLERVFAGRIPPRLALAVSGGVDSMALAALSARSLAGSTALTALTVDHRARPESTAEAIGVSKTLQSLGLVSTVLTIQDRLPDKRFEEVARVKRYELMIQYCREHGIEHLLTAHTLDDQLETFLFRLIKGSSRYGLAGMRAVVPEEFTVAEPGSAPIQLVRPLLQFEKAQLMDYCRSSGVRWVEDPTNADRTLTVRNAARLLLSPENRHKLPTALQSGSLKATIGQLQSFRDTAEQNAKAVVDRMKELRQLQFTTAGSVIFQLESGELLNAPRAVQTLVLYELLRSVSPINELAYRLSQVDDLAHKLAHIQDNADLHCVNVSVLVRRGSQGNPPVSPKGCLSVELIRQPLHARTDTPELEVPVASDWSPWKLFDNRVWLRVRAQPQSGHNGLGSEVAARNTTASFTLPSAKDLRDVKSAVNAAFENQQLSRPDWPKTRYLRSAPLLNLRGHSPQHLGFPTLGVTVPDSPVQVQHLYAYHF